VIGIIGKKMTEKDFCSDCGQNNDCKTMYQQLGKAKGPGVAGRVFWAFLFPIGVFIGSLCIFELLLAGKIANKTALTALSFILSLGVSFACVLLVSAISKRFTRTHCK
jgi:hypothetical protein